MRLRRRTRLPAPSLDTPWREAEFCVVDLETTGLNLRQDEIVSYGAVLVAEARIHCGRVAYREVQPQRPISIAALKVHTLRAADLAGAPTVDGVLDALISLLSHRFLVAHAAWIERAFLDRALGPRGLRLSRAVVDTAALIRACGLAGPDPTREPGVEAIANQLGLPVHTPHHALGDAFTTAEIFLALATRLERTYAGTARRAMSVRQLLALSRQQSR